ncbi:alpha- and gamma-adaptin-binding protein p34 [Lasioglossum baleicum]|uniref:alpha- and gamma-adaptin-binding protein p34 n=1 Tax=Lasioglossum baleicum TaxID=434251 RepID=UPI003FCCE977
MSWSKERLLIVSTAKGKGVARDIATKIGGNKVCNQGELDYYLWRIDNKYYDTVVLVGATESPTPQLNVDGIQALVVYHDPQAEDADENFKQWLPLINSLAEAGVLLFICNFITDDRVRNKVTKWCLKKKFELIELNTPDVDTAEADLDHNKHGIERIIEALHAHMWPSMTLKAKPSSTQESNFDMDKVNVELENIKLPQDSTERLPMENMLDGIMGEENADFGELFSQLMAMKEHAASLPTSQRRIAAEQLVTAFWKAMGGDPSETELD